MTDLHTISSWTVTGGLGLLSALAVIGGFPNPVSYALLILGTVLVIRFFVRSLLAYTNLERFNRLQKAALAYLKSGGQKDQEVLEERIEHLYMRWSSPLPIARLVWSNAKLAGFSYVIVALAAVTIWAGIQLRESWEAQLLTILATGAVVFETYLFARSPYFRYEKTRLPSGFGPADAERRPLGAKLKQALPAIVFGSALVAALCLVLWLNREVVLSQLGDTAASVASPTPTSPAERP